jgi:ferredoxin
MAVAECGIRENLANITVKKAPPPDSKEWEGKPDKLQYFSPNPGAGD